MKEKKTKTKVDFLERELSMPRKKSERLKQGEQLEKIRHVKHCLKSLTNHKKVFKKEKPAESER